MARTTNKGTLIIEKTVNGSEGLSGFILMYDDTLDVSNSTQIELSSGLGYFKSDTVNVTNGAYGITVDGSYRRFRFKGLTLGQLMESIEEDPLNAGIRAYLNTAAVTSTDRENLNTQIASGVKLSEAMPDQMKTAAEVNASGLAGLDTVLFDEGSSGVVVFSGGTFGSISSSSWQDHVPTTATAPTINSLSYSLQGQDSLQELAPFGGQEGGNVSFFGANVALSGNKAIVGAETWRRDDSTRVGAAFVFTKNARGTWGAGQRLEASDGAESDYFGVSVAIDGDTAFIGAYGDDDNGNNSGSVYVFTSNHEGDWSEAQKLEASDGAENDYFGVSVAIGGDTAIIGAYADDDDGINSGSAYIFTKVGDTWSETIKLNALDGADGDQFGRSVAISGDTAIVGAYSDNGAGDGNTNTDAGAAYIFTKNAGSGVWEQTAKLISSDAFSSDFFGWRVAIDGDTAVVGAYGDDTGALDGGDAGAIYIFTKDENGDWGVDSGTAGIRNENQKVSEEEAKKWDSYGYSVDIEGNTIVVGSLATNRTSFAESGEKAGAAYVYSKDLSGDWVRTHRLLSPDFDNPALSANFGYSVAVSGDSVFVGEPHSSSNEGSVSAFTVTSLQLSYTAPSNVSSSAITDYEYAIKPSGTDSTMWSAWTSLGLHTPFYIGGVTHSQDVDVKLRAVTAAGAGAESAAESVAAITFPTNDMVFTTADVANGIQITLTQGPSSDGGSPVTGYEFTYNEGLGYYPLPQDGIITTDYGITIGDTYDVALRAITLASESAWSSLLPPTGPIILTPKEGGYSGNGYSPSSYGDGYPQSDSHDSLYVGWTPGTGEGTITHQISVDNGINWIDAGTSSNTTVTGLVANTLYNVRVRATNKAGSTEDPTGAGAINFWTAEGLPDAPTNLSATSVETGFTITFDEPVDTGASEITGYEGTNGYSTFPVTNGGTVEGLQYGMSYNFRVRSINTAGVSDWSQPITVIPGLEPTLTLDSLTGQDGAVEVSFTTTGSVNAVQYSINGGASYVALPETTSPQTITGLTNGDNLTVKLRTPWGYGNYIESNEETVTVGG